MVTYWIQAPNLPFVEQVISIRKPKKIFENFEKWKIFFLLDLKCHQKNQENGLFDVILK